MIRSCTAASLAGPGRLNDAKRRSALDSHLTGSLTVRAGIGAGTFRRAGAAAILALLQPLDGNFFGAAVGSLHKGQVQIDVDIVAANRRIGISGTGGAAEAAEATAAKEGVKNISHVKAAHAAKTAGSRAASPVGRVNARVAELIVPGALIFIGQHLVSLIDLFELGLRLFITRI